MRRADVGAPSGQRLALPAPVLTTSRGPVIVAAMQRSLTHLDTRDTAAPTLWRWMPRIVGVVIAAES